MRFCFAIASVLATASVWATAALADASASRFGWETYAEFETAATNALIETNNMLDPDFTNAVHRFAQETTDENARRTAVLFEVFCSGQAGSVLPDSSVLVCETACSNLLHAATNGTLRWQDVQAASYWVEWQSVNGHPEQAFVRATNLLWSVSEKPWSKPSPTMQIALERFLNLHDVGLLSPEKTFCLDATRCAARMGDWNAVSNLLKVLYVPLRTVLFELGETSAMTDEEFDVKASTFFDYGDIFFDAAFTNFLVAASTNGTDYQQVSARMLLAIGCLEPQIPERLGDFVAVASSALDDIPGSHNPSNLWPSFLLGTEYVSYLCELNRPEDGYAIATNLLATFQALEIHEPTSPLWELAKRHVGMGDATLRETILFMTAGSAALSGDWNAASNLSASLPAPLQAELFELNDEDLCPEFLPPLSDMPQPSPPKP